MRPEIGHGCTRRLAMRRLRIASGLAALVMVVAGGLLVSGVASSGREPRSEKTPRSAPRREDASARISTATVPAGVVTLRVDFRSKREQSAPVPTVWDGQLRVSPGRVRSLRLWKEDPRDSIQLQDARWKIATHRRIPWNSVQRRRGYDKMPLEDAALVVELADVEPDSELEFKTRQGNFDLALKDVPFGAMKGFLGGLARVSRMATATTILSAPTEDDFPAAALGADGKLYVAYVAFTHGKDFRRRQPLAEAPEDLEYLAQPTGGDQVLLLRLDGDAWSAPLPVTPGGQDVYRTALAVDGSGGVWVFWSAGRDGNWDLYARRLKGGEWSREQRLTRDPGPDIFPAAAADSAGRVWVVWQAFRGGNSDVLALRQDGERFSGPEVISDDPANEWTPAIAAAADGQVAIAWDTYARGDYDVRCRIWKGEKFGRTIPVAVTPRAEMRPSITFDRAGRLWVAYEEAPEKWGKDWGALEKEGAPLYQRRSVSVRVWDAGKLWRPSEDPINAFQPWRRTQPSWRTAVRLAVPRLTTDAAGRVWLAVRSPRFGTRVAVGTAWFEHLACYNGDRWSRDVVCPSTDNILDNRPAIVPRPSGDVVLVTATDGRYAAAGRLPQWLVRSLRKKGEKIELRRPASRWPDPVNNELVMAVVGPAPGNAPARVKLDPVEPISRAGLSAGAAKERADVTRARAARVTVGGKTLQLWRGEFHRHTEISQDGGGDGLLMDMWRYGMDAASLDWIGNGDHDNGGGREYSWWITQKTTDMFQVAGAFAPMYSYERSCSYPDGHRNVVFARRGVRTLPRLRGGMGKAMDDLDSDEPRPSSPDTQLLYRYLGQFDGVCASHTSGTDMGTDWRDGNPEVEPIVEIYQGCRQSYEMPGAPRSNTAGRSIGGWRPFGFVSLALQKGYRLGFQASSDHISTHISYCCVWVEAPTRAGILAAMKARHLYGATDNIIAEVRCGDHFMGDEFSLRGQPKLQVRLTGTRPFAKVHVIKDGNYAYTGEPGKQTVEFDWTDLDAKPGKTSYYYVRGEQEDGELVWVSPMWITYEP
jgi:hypothetical protein